MREMSRGFRAMNTDVLVAIVVNGGRQATEEAVNAVNEVEALFDTIEATLSRFRPESELSRLNHSAGAPFRGSPLLLAAVEEALEAARMTDGLFDPTILAALVAAGYDRSFERLAEAPERPSNLTGEACAYCWRDVRLDRQAGTITMPVPCGLDLGGIGKGWAVDRARERIRAFRNFAVDAGGDIYASGTQADGRPWTVGIEDPAEPTQDLLILEVQDRAVATSTVAHRRWRQGGHEQHHLIDPRTGRPAESGVMQATVVADTVVRAEILAKVALLFGPEEGVRFLDQQVEAEGILVLADGRLAPSAGFPAG
ncbi:MAG TPA: FAD:protein FMN transferase [Chloroflexi bacterium]|nr:FAD:protein FMN transferase [Chloroflexota bacterium]